MQLDGYLSALVDNPSGVRTLGELIDFNDVNPSLETPVNHTSQSLYVTASTLLYGARVLLITHLHTLLNSMLLANTTTGMNSTYFEDLIRNRELGGSQGIDSALKTHNLDALILPSGLFSTTPSGMRCTGNSCRSFLMKFQ